MELLNTRPLPAGIAFGVFPSNESFLSVILKGTFSIPRSMDNARLSPKQLPIFDADVPFEPKNPAGLLRFESDLVPFKPRADIILVGKAWAPHGRATKVLDVEIQVGRTRKSLRVFGDRAWSFSPGERTPSLLSPAEFVWMPLDYDRAFGGIDERAGVGGRAQKSLPWYPPNVHGRGYVGAATVEAIHARALPNIEDPRDLIRTWDSCPPPAGCGFFPRNSSWRAKHAGTHDDRWKAQRAPAPPLDFSFEVHNAAHPDLQVPNYLVGNEAVLLTHVDPVVPQWYFRLPCLSPQLRIAPSSAMGSAAAGSAAPFRLDTLVFMPEQRIFYQVWRAIVPVLDPAASHIEVLRIDYEKLDLPERDPPELAQSAWHR